jgi:hypothetical protein
MNAKRILKETAKVGVAALCLALIAGYTSQLVRPVKSCRGVPELKALARTGNRAIGSSSSRFLGPGHSSVLAWTQE